MCLSSKLTGREKKKFLDSLPDEITVWKVLIKWGSKYKTDCRVFPVHAGIVDFKQSVIKASRRPGWRVSFNYKGGGHFFLHRESAESWAGSQYKKVVRCKIKKEWVNSIGDQWGSRVVVVKRATFPKYIGH